MTSMDASVVSKMQAQIDAWERAADSRAIFLRCYMMMTQNMLTAIERREFNDPAWVDRLLNRFADYYFVALDSYEHNPATSPAIWRLAYLSTAESHTLGIQKLLLGVNAHINYDLVLTLVELLEPEWAELSEPQRLQRYQDHCSVNDVIGLTIDAVQDQILEQDLPLLDIIDKILGPLDEFMISRLISKWREAVWQSALQIVENPEQDQRIKIIHGIEESTLRKANAFGLTNWGMALQELW